MQRQLRVTARKVGQFWGLHGALRPAILGAWPVVVGTLWEPPEWFGRPRCVKYKIMRSQVRTAREFLLVQVSTNPSSTNPTI